MTPPEITGKPRRYAMTSTKAHEQWGDFSARYPRASSVLHHLVARSGRYGSVTVSHPVLAEICGISVPTLKRALRALRDERWLQVVRVGSERGGVNCYVIDKGVCWSDERKKMEYVSFETRVVAAAKEQPSEELEHDGELRQVPTVEPGEEAIPNGDGDDPPSQQQLAGMEPVMYRDRDSGRLFEHDPETGEIQQRIENGSE